MEIKFFRPVKHGVHPFDKYERLLITDTTTFEEVPTLGEDYASQCNNKIYENISDEDIARIFIYGEYIKRKFYLDCLMERDEDGYLSNGKSKYYIRKIYNSYDEIIEDTGRQFIQHDKNVIFQINLESDVCSYSKRLPKKFNRYNFIKCVFYLYIKKLKKILRSPDLFNKNITNEDKSFINKMYENNTPSIYQCERILYALSQPDILKVMNVVSKHRRNKFGNQTVFSRLLSILMGNFNFDFNQSFLMLYRSIIDNYSMYMYDLFDMYNIDIVIKNSYKITSIPHFFFLPLKPNEDIYANKNIKVDLDIYEDKIAINIDLDNKIDSISVAKFVHDSLMSAIYQHKQNLDLDYSSNEILYFDKLINFDNQYNNTKTLEERIDGLFIWDKINKTTNAKSISSTIMNFCKKYNKFSSNDTSTRGAIMKKYTRIYSSTKKCIEELKYLPLK